MKSQSPVLDGKNESEASSSSSANNISTVADLESGVPSTFSDANAQRSQPTALVNTPPVSFKREVAAYVGAYFGMHYFNNHVIRGTDIGRHLDPTGMDGETFGCVVAGSAIGLVFVNGFRAASYDFQSLKAAARSLGAYGVKGLACAAVVGGAYVGLNHLAGNTQEQINSESTHIVDAVETVGTGLAMGAAVGLSRLGMFAYDKWKNRKKSGEFYKVLDGEPSASNDVASNSRRP